MERLQGEVMHQSRILSLTPILSFPLLSYPDDHPMELPNLDVRLE